MRPLDRASVATILVPAKGILVQPQGRSVFVPAGLLDGRDGPIVGHAKERGAELFEATAHTLNHDGFALLLAGKTRSSS